MRIAVLWKQMADYWRACFTELLAQGCDLLLVHRCATGDAPYAEEAFELPIPAIRWTDAPNEDGVSAELDRFAPDVLLVASWDVGAYRRLARRRAGEVLRVLCMDNPWLGTAKQWGGRLVSPWVIRASYDAAFLPADPQAQFARRLGFREDRILWGLYTCDHPRFSAITQRRGRELPEVFLFVGRLLRAKGVDVLAEAYGRYRATAGAPWPLVVCGTGPLVSAVAGAPGVEWTGFVQPDDVPALYARAGCLVLPSRFEPWGIVVHEAASAGLPVICTSATGASSRLVVDGYNGTLVGAGDARGLGEAMGRMASASADERAAMGRRSATLAGQFTPRRWAAYLRERSTKLLGDLHLSPAPAGRRRRP